MICRLEIYNKELNLFPVVSSSSMTLQITLGNIIKGDKGDPGEPGKDGEDGQPGKDGKDGVNGKSPYIGDNGNWFEYDESGNPVDTGVKAKTENVVEYSEIGSDMDPGLIKFFSVFGITYNEATNLFEYRDFDNLSIDEVLEAYKYYVPVFGPNTAFLYHNAQIMFNIMPPSTDNHQLYGNFEDRNADYMFAGCTAEVVYLCKEGDDEQFSVASCESIFASCDNLRIVVGRLDVYHASRLPALSFQCPNLEEISIYNLNCDIFLDNCPKLSAESLRFMAIHSYYQSHHNIHVHPDVWAKIQDVNNTDYHSLLELEGSSNYNVTFVEAS